MAIINRNKSKLVLHIIIGAVDHWIVFRVSAYFVCIPVTLSWYKQYRILKKIM